MRTKMRKKLVLSFVTGAVLLLGAAVTFFSSHSSHEEVFVIEKNPFEVWSVYNGTLEARRSEVIMSAFNGSAVIVELAPEGLHVKRGDVLVRFDDSRLRQDIVGLERDYDMARMELDAFKQAEMPLELKNIEMAVLDACDIHNSEKQYLEDSLELVEEGLVSKQEIEKQRLVVQKAEAAFSNLTMKLDFTKEYLHPSQMHRKQATFSAAEQALSFAKQQIESCAVTAPSDGIVAYKPIHVGTEFRTVRIGDTIYKNQPFMLIPDMSDIVVKCNIPEAELSFVSPGSKALIRPLSYPDITLHGKVESIGTMAQNLPGRGYAEKFFNAVISVSDQEERLRPGMSASVKILSYHTPEAVALPRNAVFWKKGAPYCIVSGSTGQPEERALTIGHANEEYFEILDGVAVGERFLRKR